MMTREHHRRRSPETRRRRKERRDSREQLQSQQISAPISRYPERPEPVDVQTRAFSPISSSSSTSSSLVNISRPSRFGLSRFFSGSGGHKQHRVKKKRSRILKFGNSSSSSVGSDLAYGKGYIERRRSREISPASPASPGRPQLSRRAQTDEEILELGRKFAEIARQQNAEDLRAAGRSRPSTLVGAATALSQFRRTTSGNSSRGIGSSKIRHESSDDSEWESASDDDDSSSSEFDSGLAYGSGLSLPSDSAKQLVQPRESPRPVRSPRPRDSPRSPRPSQAPTYSSPPPQRNSVVDPSLFGPVNSLRGYVQTPCGFETTERPAPSGSRRSYQPSIPPSEAISESPSLQRVFPIPTSDPSRFDAARGSVVSSRQEIPTPPRPAPVPIQPPLIQQPKPIAPVSRKVLDSVETDSRYSERSLSRKALGEAAVAGVAGAAAGAALNADRRGEPDRHGVTRDRAGNDRSKHSDAGVRDERIEQYKSRDDEPRGFREIREDRLARRREKQNEQDQDRGRERRHQEKPAPQYEQDSERERRSRDKYRDVSLDYDRTHDKREDERRYERKTERREDRREERHDEDRPSRSVDYSKRQEGSGRPPREGPIDPFQFQVPEDAFQTPTYTTPKRPLTPNIVTVDREPDFSKYDLEDDEMHPPERLSRRDSYERELRDAREVYEATEHATAPVSEAAFAAAAAAVIAEDRRGRSRSRGGDASSRNRSRRGDSPKREKDAVQEDADRYYREAELARRIREEEKRSRSVDDSSVVDKWSHDQKQDSVEIVSPPQMERQKQKSPYDAPDADVRIDNILEDPSELSRFRVPLIRGLRDPSAERERPMLNVIRPTPIPTPVPDRQRPAEKSFEPAKVDAPAPNAVITPRGEVVPAPPTPKSVSWGENQTKHYVLESPEREDDPYSGTKIVTPAKSPKSKGKKSTWGMITDAINGVNDDDTAPSVADRAVDAEVSRTRRYSIDQEKSAWRKSRPPLEEVYASPPIPGPKPRTLRGVEMPGAFAEDPTFTANIAAALEGSGFDPNIVIDNPSFHKRESPPNSNDPGIYRSPFAETVTDLGIIETSPSGVSQNGQEHGFVIGEVPETPDDDDISTRNSQILSKLNEKEERKQVDSEKPEVIKDDRDFGDSETSSKPSKKEKKRREKIVRGPTPVDGAAIDDSARKEQLEAEFMGVADEDDDSSPKKKKSKKSRKAIVVQDDSRHPDFTENSNVTVPVDAFRDVQDARDSNLEDAWDLPGTHDRRSRRDSDAHRPSRSAPISELSTESSYRVIDTDSIPATDDEWDAPKSERRSNRDSGVFDSPSRSVLASEASLEFVRRATDFDEEQSTSKKSSKSKRGSIDYEFMRSPAQSTDDLDDLSKSKRKSKRESGIYDFPSRIEPSIDTISESPKELSESLEDLRSEKIAVTGGWDTPTKSKKKSKRDSAAYGDLPSTPVAQSPAPSEASVSSSRRSRHGSYPGSPSRSAPSSEKGVENSRKKSKKKRRSTPGDFPDEGALPDSTGDRSGNLDRDISTALPDPSHFDHDRSSKSRARDDITDDTKSVASTPDRKSSKPEKERKSTGTSSFFDRFKSSIGIAEEKERSRKPGGDKGPFLGNADALGAGVGSTSAAATPTSQESRSNATNVPLEEEAQTIRFTPEGESNGSQEAELIDPEIAPREIRPAIDPRYGDLLPLPPSRPGSPVPELSDNYPDLPDSRPVTPEHQRLLREIQTHSRRRSTLETPTRPKTPSQSAIPIQFRLGHRNTPSNGKSSPTVSPIVGHPEVSSEQKSRSRPTSWEGSSREFKPLLLLQRASRGSITSVDTSSSPEREVSPSESEIREHRSRSLKRLMAAESPDRDAQLRDINASPVASTPKDYIERSDVAHAAEISKRLDDFALGKSSDEPFHRQDIEVHESHLESVPEQPLLESAGDAEVVSPKSQFVELKRTTRSADLPSSPLADKRPSDANLPQSPELPTSTQRRIDFSDPEEDGHNDSFEDASTLVEATTSGIRGKRIVPGHDVNKLANQSDVADFSKPQDKSVFASDILNEDEIRELSGPLDTNFLMKDSQPIDIGGHIEGDEKAQDEKPGSEAMWWEGSTVVGALPVNEEVVPSKDVTEQAHPVEQADETASSSVQQQDESTTPKKSKKKKKKNRKSQASEPSLDEQPLVADTQDTTGLEEAPGQPVEDTAPVNDIPTSTEQPLATADDKPIAIEEPIVIEGDSVDTSKVLPAPEHEILTRDPELEPITVEHEPTTSDEKESTVDIVPQPEISPAEQQNPPAEHSVSELEQIVDQEKPTQEPEVAPVESISSIELKHPPVTLETEETTMTEPDTQQTTVPGLETEDTVLTEPELPTIEPEPSIGETIAETKEDAQLESHATKLGIPPVDAPTAESEPPIPESELSTTKPESPTQEPTISTTEDADVVPIEQGSKEISTAQLDPTHAEGDLPAESTPSTEPKPLEVEEPVITTQDLPTIEEEKFEEPATPTAESSSASKKGKKKKKKSKQQPPLEQEQLEPATSVEESAPPAEQLTKETSVEKSGPPPVDPQTSSQDQPETAPSQGSRSTQRTLTKGLPSFSFWNSMWKGKKPQTELPKPQVEVAENKTSVQEEITRRPAQAPSTPQAQEVEPTQPTENQELDGPLDVVEHSIERNEAESDLNQPTEEKSPRPSETGKDEETLKESTSPEGPIELGLSELKEDNHGNHQPALPSDIGHEQAVPISEPIVEETPLLHETTKSREPEDISILYEGPRDEQANEAQPTSATTSVQNPVEEPLSGSKSLESSNVDELSPRPNALGGEDTGEQPDPASIDPLPAPLSETNSPEILEGKSLEQIEAVEDVQPSNLPTEPIAEEPQEMALSRSDPDSKEGKNEKQRQDTSAATDTPVETDIVQGPVLESRSSESNANDLPVTSDGPEQLVEPAEQVATDLPSEPTTPVKKSKKGKKNKRKNSDALGLTELETPIVEEPQVSDNITTKEINAEGSKQEEKQQETQLDKPVIESQPDVEIVHEPVPQQPESTSENVLVEPKSPDKANQSIDIPNLDDQPAESTQSVEEPKTVEIEAGESQPIDDSQNPVSTPDLTADNQLEDTQVPEAESKPSKKKAKKTRSPTQTESTTLEEKSEISAAQDDSNDKVTPQFEPAVDVGTISDDMQVNQPRDATDGAISALKEINIPQSQETRDIEETTPTPIVAQEISTEPSVITEEVVQDRKDESDSAAASVSTKKSKEDEETKRQSVQPTELPEESQMEVPVEAAGEFSAPEFPATSGLNFDTDWGSAEMPAPPDFFSQPKDNFDSVSEGLDDSLGTQRDTFQDRPTDQFETSSQQPESEDENHSVSAIAQVDTSHLQNASLPTILEEPTAEKSAEDLTDDGAEKLREQSIVEISSDSKATDAQLPTEDVVSDEHQDEDKVHGKIPDVQEPAVHDDSQVVPTLPEQTVPTETDNTEIAQPDDEFAQPIETPTETSVVAMPRAEELTAPISIDDDQSRGLTDSANPSESQRQTSSARDTDLANEEDVLAATQKSEKDKELESEDQGARESASEVVTQGEEPSIESSLEQKDVPLTTSQTQPEPGVVEPEIQTATGLHELASQPPEDSQTIGIETGKIQNDSQVQDSEPSSTFPSEQSQPEQTQPTVHDDNQARSLEPLDSSPAQEIETQQPSVETEAPGQPELVIPENVQKADVPDLPVQIQTPQETEYRPSDAIGETSQPQSTQQPADQVQKAGDNVSTIETGPEAAPSGDTDARDSDKWEESRQTMDLTNNTTPEQTQESVAELPIRDEASKEDPEDKVTPESPKDKKRRSSQVISDTVSAFSQDVLAVQTPPDQAMGSVEGIPTDVKDIEPDQPSLPTQVETIESQIEKNPAEQPKEDESKELETSQDSNVSQQAEEQLIPSTTDEQIDKDIQTSVENPKDEMVAEPALPKEANTAIEYGSKADLSEVIAGDASGIGSIEQAETSAPTQQISRDDEPIDIVSPKKNKKGKKKKKSNRSDDVQSEEAPSQEQIDPFVQQEPVAEPTVAENVIESEPKVEPNLMVEPESVGEPDVSEKQETESQSPEVPKDAATEEVTTVKENNEMSPEQEPIEADVDVAHSAPIPEQVDEKIQDIPEPVEDQVTVDATPSKKSKKDKKKKRRSTAGSELEPQTPTESSAASRSTELPIEPIPSDSQPTNMGDVMAEQDQSSQQVDTADNQRAKDPPAESNTPLSKPAEDVFDAPVARELQLEDAEPDANQLETTHVLEEPIGQTPTSPEQPQESREIPEDTIKSTTDIPTMERFPEASNSNDGKREAVVDQQPESETIAPLGSQEKSIPGVIESVEPTESLPKVEEPIPTGEITDAQESTPSKLSKKERRRLKKLAAEAELERSREAENEPSTTEGAQDQSKKPAEQVNPIAEVEALPQTSTLPVNTEENLQQPTLEPESPNHGIDQVTDVAEQEVNEKTTSDNKEQALLSPSRDITIAHEDGVKDIPADEITNPILEHVQEPTSDLSAFTVQDPGDEKDIEALPTSSIGSKEIDIELQSQPHVLPSTEKQDKTITGNEAPVAGTQLPVEPEHAPDSSKAAEVSSTDQGEQITIEEQIEPEAAVPNEPNPESEPPTTPRKKSKKDKKKKKKSTGTQAESEPQGSTATEGEWIESPIKTTQNEKRRNASGTSTPMESMEAVPANALLEIVTEKNARGRLTREDILEVEGQSSTKEDVQYQPKSPKQRNQDENAEDFNISHPPREVVTGSENDQLTSLTEDEQRVQPDEGLASEFAQETSSHVEQAMPTSRPRTPPTTAAPAISIDLSPAQLSSHVEHDRPFDQSAQPGKKAKIHLSSNDAMVREPLSTQPSVPQSTETPGNKMHELLPPTGQAIPTIEYNDDVMLQEMTPAREIAASYLESRPISIHDDLATANENVNVEPISTSGLLPIATPRQETSSSYFEGYQDDGLKHDVLGQVSTSTVTEPQDIPISRPEQQQSQQKPEHVQEEIASEKSTQTRVPSPIEDLTPTAREIAASLMESHSKSSEEKETPKNADRTTTEVASVSPIAEGGAHLSEISDSSEKNKEQNRADDPQQSPERETLEGDKQDADTGDLRPSPSDEAAYNTEKPILNATKARATDTPPIQGAITEDVESPIVGREVRHDLPRPRDTYRDSPISKEPPTTEIIESLDDLDTSEHIIEASEQTTDLKFDVGSHKSLGPSFSPSPKPAAQDFLSSARSSVHSSGRNSPRVLPPVEEETREELETERKIRDRGAGDKTSATPEPQRDSGFVADSPGSVQHSFVDDLNRRDSGVHLRDISESTPKKQEGLLEEERRTIQTPEPYERRNKRLGLGSETPKLPTPIARDQKDAQKTIEPRKTRASPTLQDILGQRSLSDNISRASTPQSEMQPRRSASNTSISRRRTPNPLLFRPGSPGSFSIRPGANTPPLLRRADKRMSGDLRTLSSSLSNNNASSENLHQQSTTPVHPTANEGRVRAKDMTDVYVSNLDLHFV
ncbi:hypothetical protein M426DRAFT_106166 [Hypoxylon sp. CI-4A]|nr:hypothetical protein M426DRAFT_106166 [Hypoxylon sp. CI-4A]